MFDQIIILRKPRIKHRKPGLAVDQSSFLAIEIRFPFFKSFLENVLQQKTPVRKPNAELRHREYLTAAEVEKLIEVARGNRWGLRDATMILVAFRHGFRSSELTDLRWDQIDFKHGVMHVRRVKKGTRVAGVGARAARRP